jgi:hypothetical protein
VPDFQKIAAEFQKIVTALGVKKQEIQEVLDKGGDDKRVSDALDAVDNLFKDIDDKITTTAVTEEERKRKITQLKSDISVLRLIDATDPDFDRRIQAERDLARLTAQLGVYEAQTVLNFGDLLNEDETTLKAALAQAAKDIQARKNLARVLKGIEIGLRVAAFSGGLAGKLGVTAAV